MAFTVKDFADLRRLLTTHPEWRVELRQMVLTDDLLTLPAVLRELVQAQTGTEARLGALTARVQELAAAQQRTEQRVEELAQAQTRTEARLETLAARMEELAQAQTRTEARLETLAARVEEWARAQKDMQIEVIRLSDSEKRLVIHMADMRGWRMEERYRLNAGAFWGKWLRPVEALFPHVLRDALEARLSDEEVDEVMHLDLIVHGRARHLPENPEVWLALEVSATIGREDIERAQRRAALLRKAEYRAVPAVDGEEVNAEATMLLQDAPVILMLDGRSQGWEQAFAAV